MGLPIFTKITEQFIRKYNDTTNDSRPTGERGYNRPNGGGVTAGRRGFTAAWVDFRLATARRGRGNSGDSVMSGGGRLCTVKRPAIGACRDMLGAGREAGTDIYGLEKKGLEWGFISSKTASFWCQKHKNDVVLMLKKKINRTIRFRVNRPVRPVRSQFNLFLV